jgi:tetratricopeptide (TPR) repeat protein
VGTLLLGLVEALGVDEEDRELLVSSKLPFEAFIESVLMSLPRAEGPLLDIFRHGVPGTFHHFIAELAKTGSLRSVFTTNFDLQFELALEKPGIGFVRGRDFVVHSKEEELETPDDGRFRVLKLHGSIDDVPSLRHVLGSICRQTSLEKRQRIVRGLFERRTDTDVLLIVGYSLSDAFDIVPAIRAALPPRKLVYFVQHANAPENRTLRGFEAESPLCSYTGWRLVMDTGALVRTLWEALLATTYRAEGAREGEASDRLRAWVSRLASEDLPAKARAASQVCFALGRYDLARKYALRQLSTANDEAEPVLASAMLAAVAEKVAAAVPGRPSRESIERMCELAAHLEERTDIASIRALAMQYTTIGENLRKCGELERAMEFHRRALRLASESGGQREQAFAWMNMATVHGQSGDMAEGQAAHEHYRNVLSCSERALAVFELLGAPNEQAKCHMNSGLALNMLGERQSAVLALSRARRLFVACGDLRYLPSVELKLREILSSS